MFGRKRKVNNNYYVSPLPEAYLGKAAIKASVIIIATCALIIPAFVLWIYPGIGSLLWLYGLFEANMIYLLLFAATGIGTLVCSIMSFYGYKIRKEVKQVSAPTFGFRKASYNGIFFTAIFATALLIYHLVILIGYHIAASNGYIAELIAKIVLESPKDAVGKSSAFDTIGVIVAVFYALVAGGVWTYYFYTFRVNRSMQFVCPDEVQPDEAPAIPTPEEAEENYPNDRVRYFGSPYGLTEEEKEEGKKAFRDDEPDKKKGKKKK